MQMKMRLFPFIPFWPMNAFVVDEFQADIM